MESAAAYNQRKHTIQPIRKVASDENRTATKSSGNSARVRDPVDFTDLPYVLDYTTWLNPKIDPSIQLSVKGDISQLHYSFENIGDEVVTTTRPFSSRPNGKIPMVLPDYSSPYYTSSNGNQSNSGTNDSADSDSDMITDSNFIVDDSTTAHSATTAAATSNESNNVVEDEDEDEAVKNSLGLRAFHLINTDRKLDFNITEELADPTTLKIADFETGCRALHSYSYAKSILESDNYRTEIKEEIRDWLKEMPPAPDDTNRGFPEGTAESLFPNFQNMFLNVVQLSREVRRTNENDYESTNSADPSNEPLEEIPHLLTVCDSKNSEQALLNRAIMMAVTTNNPKQAQKVVDLQQKKEAKMKRSAAKSSRALDINNHQKSKSDYQSDGNNPEYKKKQKKQDGKVVDDDESDDESNDESEDEKNESYDEDGDSFNYWTDLMLKSAPMKKYTLSHISVDTAIELNQTLIQLKSDVTIDGIPSKSYGIVIKDELKGRTNRSRMLTVQFLKKKCVINNLQAFLVTEIN